MGRLSIEITSEQHQRLKAVAALHGKSIKEYVLERTLPFAPDMESLEKALQKLENFLKPSIKATEKGKTSSRSVKVFKDVKK